MALGKWMWLCEPAGDCSPNDRLQYLPHEVRAMPRLPGFTHFRLQ